MSDNVNHPRHYTSHPSKVEAIEICEHLDFCLGNAVKYLFRVGLKDDAKQDLKKAAWYLDRALKLKNRGLSPRRPLVIVPALTKVIDNELPGSTLREVLQLVVVHVLNGDEPRIADALACVERAIELEETIHA